MDTCRHIFVATVCPFLEIEYCNPKFSSVNEGGQVHMYHQFTNSAFMAVMVHLYNAMLGFRDRGLYCHHAV